MATRVDRQLRHSGLVALLLVALLTPAGVSALETVIPLQISLSNPGARSLGFGGAFTALADDATAAFANPAGLVQLLKPEVSIEGRNWHYSTPFTEGGRVEGLPSGFGIDTTAGLRTARSEHHATGLSFFSVAYPKGDWSLAFFRHQYANLEFSGETQGLFGGGTSCCQQRLYDQRMASELDVVSYGISAAYRFGDRFNVGLGVIYHDSSLTSNTTEFRFDDDTVQSVFARNSYLPGRSYLSQRFFSDDMDWTVTAGFLWRLSDSLTAGGVYRQGLQMHLGTEVTAGQAPDPGVSPGELLLRVTGFPLKLPDTYGLGLAYRAPDGRLTVSFQWDRVEYSDIPASLGLDDATVDDANELHLGAEYVFLASTPIIAVRLGTWLEPDHQVRTTTGDPFTRALLPRRKDQIHYAAGLGLALERFQIDLAVDFADTVDTVSLSAIYSF
jgi:long-subunit fatty acid transport protein